MADASFNAQVNQGLSQLAQVRAAIEEAGEIFGRKDAGGRTPIVVIPKRQNRIRWGLITFAVFIFIAGVAGGSVLDNGLISTLGFLIAAGLICSACCARCISRCRKA